MGHLQWKITVSKSVIKCSRWLRITQHRSVSKSDGCFQWRLFVCGFVCLFVNTVTPERVNIGWWNLEGRCTVHKSWPSSNLWVIAPTGVRNPQKMWRFAESCPMTQNVNKAMRADETSHRTQPAHSTYLWLRRWENQCRLSSYLVHMIRKVVIFSTVRETWKFVAVLRWEVTEASRWLYRRQRRLDAGLRYSHTHTNNIPPLSVILRNLSRKMSTI